jgi:hypothetical protein
MSTTNQSSPSIAQLEHILRTQVEGYGRLCSALDRKRAAIALAQLDRVPEIAQVEHQIIDRLSDLDARREAEITNVCVALNLEREGVLMSTIIAALTKEDGERLETLVATLREVIEKARTESSVIRTAGEALSRHMAGVVQSVRGVLAGAHIYGSRGQITTGVATAGGLDMSS